MSLTANFKGFKAVPTEPREWNNYFRENFSFLESYTVAGVPPAAPAAQIIYVSNESGGAVLAFSDGTNWRRVTDRAVIS